MIAPSLNGHAKRVEIIVTRAELREQVAEAVARELDARSVPGDQTRALVTAAAWIVLCVVILLAAAGWIPWW